MLTTDSQFVLYYTYVILAISSVHSYAFVVSCINYRYSKSELGKVVVHLNGMSAVHGLSQFLIFLPVDSDLKFIVSHLVLMETYLILIFYLRAICTYMQLKQRGLVLLQNLYYLSLFILCFVLIYLLVTGKSVIFEYTMLKTNNLIYNHNDFPITPNIVSTIFIAIGMIGFILFCLRSVYEIAIRPRPDYFILSGMIISIAANMNDVSIIYGNLKYAVPLFVVSNFIECGRMTYVTQKNTFLRFSESSALANSVRRVIHDIRRPFSYIRIFMINIENQLKKSDKELLNKVKELKKNLDQSHQEVERMLGELLDIGREQSVEKAVFSLHDLATECLDHFFKFDERNDWITLIQMKHSKPVYADRAKMKRVLENLISNALKQAWLPAGQKKVLIIESSSGQRSFRISVTNTGSWVEPERINAIFSQFYTKNNVSGKGIGLAICKKYVELHGGSIRCSSDKESCKTIFTIELPLRRTGSGASQQP